MKTSSILIAFALAAAATLAACGTPEPPRFASDEPLSPWAKYGAEAAAGGGDAGGGDAGTSE